MSILGGDSSTTLATSNNTTNVSYGADNGAIVANNSKITLSDQGAIEKASQVTIASINAQQKTLTDALTQTLTANSNVSKSANTTITDAINSLVDTVKSALTFAGTQDSQARQFAQAASQNALTLARDAVQPSAGVWDRLAQFAPLLVIGVVTVMIFRGNG